ncbi:MULTISPECIES: DUF4835 family protein [unclassified Parabacteroides]|uniref:type IX secretion system protein PorD n=1 Tax=unclassified Parabacteroides TaxID=2649774 RepID=UPI002474FB6C|nr:MULTISPECIES: DUF4835 family protein [unclassified Parabacteroides]
MRTKIILFLLSFISVYAADAQEINARITVNSDKIQGSKEIYTSLQTALTEFVNTRKWTDATFAVNEKIDCTMTLIINERNGDNFKSEIQIQARRPVYNSSYMTTTLNFRDVQLDFEYIEFSPLEYTENTLQSNLTATIVYYIYVILGLDFDTFSPKGGTAFLQQAQQIVNLCQSQMGWNGWKAFENTRNRHALITALTENQAESFRNLWYTYHRKGLDEMAANADRGRTTILEALPVMEEYKSSRPNSVLLQAFSDAKLDEIVAMYSKANSQEKQAGYKLLSNLFPAESSRLESLKK